jgi:hypothetical protein
MYIHTVIYIDTFSRQCTYVCVSCLVIKLIICTVLLLWIHTHECAGLHIYVHKYIHLVKTVVLTLSLHYESMYYEYECMNNKQIYIYVYFYGF